MNKFKLWLYSKSGFDAPNQSNFDHPGKSNKWPEIGQA